MFLRRVYESGRSGLRSKVGECGAAPREMRGGGKAEAGEARPRTAFQGCCEDAVKLGALTRCNLGELAGIAL